MPAKIVPLSGSQHGNFRLLPLKSYSYAALTHIAVLLPNEFPIVCATYPIVFIPRNDKFQAAVLLGLQEKQNLFVDQNGRWLAGYIPAAIRRYPFSLAKRENADELMLCVDLSSGLFSENDGEALFSEEGLPTPILQKTQKFMTEFMQFARYGETLFNDETLKTLFVPMKIQLSNGEDKAAGMTGVFRIDESKLGDLSDEAFIGLRKKGLLPLIYAHLLSLKTIKQLGERLRIGAAASRRGATAVPKNDTLPDTFNFG